MSKSVIVSIIIIAAVVIGGLLAYFISTNIPKEAK